MAVLRPSKLRDEPPVLTDEAPHSSGITVAFQGREDALLEELRKHHGLRDAALKEISC
jgi:hypothetical protein